MSIMTARPIEIPIESQCRFHVDHFAAAAGTLTVRQASSSPRPSAACDRSSQGPPSISTASGVYMYTPDSWLHVRVVFHGVGC